MPTLAGGGDGDHIGEASDIQNLLAAIGADDLPYFSFAAPFYQEAEGAPEPAASLPAAPEAAAAPDIAAPDIAAPDISDRVVAAPAEPSPDAEPDDQPDADAAAAAAASAPTAPRVDDLTVGDPGPEAPPPVVAAPEVRRATPVLGSAPHVAAHMEIEPPADMDDAGPAASYVSLEAADALRAIAAASLESAGSLKPATPTIPLAQRGPTEAAKPIEPPEVETAAEAPPPPQAAPPEAPAAPDPPSPAPEPDVSAGVEAAPDPEPEPDPAKVDEDPAEATTMEQLFAPVESRKPGLPATPRQEPEVAGPADDAAAAASAPEPPRQRARPKAAAKSGTSDAPVQGTLEDLFRRL